MKQFFLGIFILGWIGSLSHGTSQTLQFDHCAFDEILKEYVDHKGRVNYLGLQRHGMDELNQYLERLAKINIEEYNQNEKMAIYINAYNAFTLKLITKHYPIDSIKKIPGVSGWTGTGQWTKKFWTLGNKKISLNIIEHKILRPMGDPRIHFSLVCASISCPNLARFAFTGKDLNGQLNKQARLFNQSPKGVQYKMKKDRPVLMLSSIYKWFKEDFLKSAQNLPSFVEPYASSSAREFIKKNRGQLKIEYMDYNWGVNDKRYRT